VSDPRHARGHGIGVLAALVLCLPGLGAAAAEDKAAASAPATPTAPAAIAVDKVAPSATEVARLLGTFAAHLVPGAEVEAIRAALPAASASLAQEWARTLALIEGEASLEALQTQGQLWYRRQAQWTAWLDRLSARAAGLQDALTRLEDLHGTWTRTRSAAQAATASASVVQQIDATLAAIEAAQPPTREHRDKALDLQGRIAQEVVRCETARARIAALQQGAVGGILTGDRHPIWAPDIWAQARAALPGRWSQVIDEYRADLWLYLRDPSKRMPLHLGLFALTLIALLAARRQMGQWAAEGKGVERVTAVFDHPVAAASLLALMAATLYTSPAPFAVKQMLGALALWPIVVLTSPGFSPSVVPLLYALGVLFALDTLRHAFGGIPPLVDQAILLLEAVAGIGLLVWVFGRGALRWAPLHAGGQDRRTPWRFLLGLVFCTLAIGLIASLFGYLRIARLTTPAVLVGAADALWLYAVVEVGTAVIAYALRVWPLRNALMVRRHGPLLMARSHRLLAVLAVLGWSVRYLSYLGLFEPTLALVEDGLTLSLQMGGFSTSVGDILAFLTTLVVGYWLSALVRFVLQEEIYPRAGVAPGLSYAASSVFHYAILTLTFLLALGFLGVSLTQVTVLAGALGVGIGFGLQGVVNNFVSGLILLFERPINVGDAVQVGDLQGWVRRIGIRASVVRTVQGAEIIVPNAQMTTQQVTNWTLSDQQRRIDLPVGLSYGAAPRTVIGLLEGVARAHPLVFQDPPPQCLFMGYGDSSINFELRAWTDYVHWIQVQSELTVAVYDAVYAAGLTFPFPQREVRLLSERVTVPPAASGGP
jgi:small-conductance mechanosensitive channel